MLPPLRPVFYEIVCYVENIGADTGWHIARPWVIAQAER